MYSIELNDLNEEWRRLKSPTLSLCEGLLERLDS